MKIFTFVTALGLLATLAIPAQLAAQDNATLDHKPKPYGQKSQMH